MALLTLTKIAKSYDPARPLIEDVSLVVRSKDRLGLIGPNGAGKSTLLKIMAGLELADDGERIIRRDTRIGYLEQEPHFEEARTIREIVRSGIIGRNELLAEMDQMYEKMADPQVAAELLEKLSYRQEKMQIRLDAMGGHDVEHRVSAAIDGVGLPNPEAQCGTLSGGEARRVALAQLLVASPDLLLLDEPTNHLDAFVVAWLEQQLASLKVPLVLVTHDRYLLDRVVDRIVEIDRGVAHAYEAGYGKYLELRAARLESEAKTEKSRLQLLKRETAWMRAGVQGRGTKAKARILRYDDLVASSPTARSGDLELAFPDGPRLGSKVLQLHQVGHRYADNLVLKPLDLQIENGMRLGVVGPNGAGKSTLLKILLGQLDPSLGEVVVGETVKFGTIDQKREDLEDADTIVEEVAGKSDYVLVGQHRIHVASFLDRFLFPGDRKFVSVGTLSGGERGRILLAKLMLSGANFLVLDEPTNDLDLNTLRALEEAVCAFAGTVVVVSHDRWFLDRVATHILHLDDQGNSHLHAGDLSSLLARMSEQKAERQRAQRKSQSASASKPSAKSTSRSKKGLSTQEKKLLEQLLEQITEVEQSLDNIDQRLADPELYLQRGDQAGELQAKRTRLQQQLEQDSARWEELAEREA
jgi:ABC transport system ATP-binding/permease protein